MEIKFIVLCLYAISVKLLKEGKIVFCKIVSAKLYSVCFFQNILIILQSQPTPKSDWTDGWVLHT